MIWIALGLAAAGLGLSAFFSGSETGLYRVTRIRLVLDALGGGPVAWGLAWLTNHPSLFVATALVGNNLGNYLISLAIVLATQQLLPGGGHAAELLVPVALAPLVFIYGELLPKNLFLHAPYRMLRRTGPWFLACVVLFLPATAVLWLLDRLLARAVRQSAEPVRLTLARRELRRVLDEGHQAGVLHPSQGRLAQGIFAVAGRPVARDAVPLSQVVRARADGTREEIEQLARQLGQPVVAVEEAGAEPRLIGYVRVMDLALSPSGDAASVLRPLLEIPHTDSHLDALMRMHAAQESLARVIDAQGRTLGLLTERQLREPLFRGG